MPIPKKLKNTGTLTEIAEALADRLDSSPWPITAFLVLDKQNSRPILHAFKAQSPECERFRRANGCREVGTYNRFVSFKDLKDDLMYAEGHL